MIITFLASILIWILLAAVVLVARTKTRQVAAAFVLALVCAYIVKSVIPSSRPFVLGASTPLTLTTHTDNAFPSGHAAAAFAMAVTIWLHNRRLGYLYLGLAALIGMSRVWANVHWPIDIVGGAALGTLIAALLHKSWSR